MQMRFLQLDVFCFNIEIYAFFLRFFVAFRNSKSWQVIVCFYRLLLAQSNQFLLMACLPPCRMETLICSCDDSRSPGDVTFEVPSFYVFSSFLEILNYIT